MSTGRRYAVLAHCGVVVACMLAGCGKPAEKAETAVATAPVPGAGEAARAAALAEVERLRSADPAAAVKRCREQVTAASGAAERDRAAEMLPLCLYAEFQALMKQKAIDAAGAVLAEQARASTPESLGELSWACTSWAEYWTREYTRLAQAGDAAAVTAIGERLRRFEPRNESLQSLLQKLGEWHLRRWQESQAGGAAAAVTPDLDAAAGLACAGHGAESFMQHVQPGLDGPKAALLVAQAEAEPGHRELALLLRLIALHRFSGSEEGRRAAEDAVARAAVGLADAMLQATDQPVRLSAESLARVLRQAGHLDRAGAAGITLGERRVAVALVAAREAVERRAFAVAESHVRDGMEAVRDLWQARCDMPEFDVWAVAPRDLVERVDDEYPRAKPEERRSYLRQFLGESSAPLAEQKPLREYLPLLYAKWGVLELARERPGALEHLRTVFRNSPDEAVADLARVGLQKAFRRAVRGKDVEALQDLAAFYVAEAMSRGVKDSFTGELCAGLEEAATAFAKAGAREKEYFILTLLADLFAGEAAGEQARLKAVAAGREIVRRTPVTTDPPPRPLMPTGQAGLSVLLIENETVYHLLLYLEGPETFFVRINPLRRASVVLKDGKYTTGVIVTSDDTVRPYHGEVTYAGTVTRHAYVIRQEGSRAGDKPPLLDCGDSTGAFALVRMPPGLDVEPMRRVAEGRLLPQEENAGITTAMAKAASANGSEACDALRQLKVERKSEAVFGVVAKAAQTHESADVRRLAVETLVPFRHHFPVKEVWLTRLKTDADAEVQAAAARALLQGFDPVPAEAVASMAAHPQSAIRLQLVATAAGGPPAMTTQAAGELLQRLSEQDPDASVRRQALEAACVLHAPYAAAVVKRGLVSRDKDEFSTARLLSRHWLGNDEILDALLAALADPAKKASRYDLLLVIGHWDSPKVLAVTKTILRGPVSVEQYALMAGLAERLPAPVDTELRQAMASIAADPKQKMTRELALRLLCQWQAAEALNPVATALADTTLHFRSDIITWLLPWLAEPKVRALLEPYRADPRLGRTVVAALVAPTADSGAPLPAGKARRPRR